MQLADNTKVLLHLFCTISSLNLETLNEIMRYNVVIATCTGDEVEAEVAFMTRIEIENEVPSNSNKRLNLP